MANEAPRSRRQPSEDAAGSEAGGEAPSFGTPAFWVGVGLVVLIAFTYWPVSRHGFVGLDDQGYVERNPQVRAGLTAAGAAWAFTTGAMGNWHPLTWLSHMLDVQLFDLDAGTHHVVNLFLHIINTLLLFALLRRMTGTLFRSAFVAALFALHPLHVESVAWIAERKDVLSTLFFMLTLLAYVVYVERRSVLRYTIVTVLFALGLMAKPMLVTLPFVLLLLDWWPLGRMQAWRLGAWGLRPGASGLGPGALVLEKLPLFALALASSVVTFIVQQKGGAVAASDALPIGVRVTSALSGYVMYLVKAIWPAHLSVFYPLSRSVPAWHGLVAFAILAALTFVLLRAARRHPYLGVGWLWFLGMLVPVIGLLQVGLQAMADRYTYVPLIGIFIIVAWGAEELLARMPARRVVLLSAAAAVVAACTVVTRAQVNVWRDSMTLWQHALDADPGNYRAHSAVGGMLAESGKPQEALPHLQEAVRLEPDFPDTHNNLGRALAELGRLDDALVEYRTAIRLNPNVADPHHNLGVVLARQGKTDEAIAAYRDALRIDPTQVVAYTNLALALSTQGKYADAMAAYSEALRLEPGAADVQRNVGLMLVREGKVNESVARYQEALRLKPDFAEAHDDLGFALQALGKVDDAIFHYREAVRLKPDLGSAHNHLGFVLVVSGKITEAITHFRDAVRIEPDSEMAHTHLGMALAVNGKRDEAIREFQEVLRINPANESAKQRLAALLKQGGR